MAGRFSFSPRRSGLNPRFIPDSPCKRKKTKIRHSYLRKSVISPSLRPSGYVPDRIAVESYHSHGIIGSYLGNDRDLSEEV